MTIIHNPRINFQSISNIGAKYTNLNRVIKLKEKRLLKIILLHRLRLSQIFADIFFPPPHFSESKSFPCKVPSKRVLETNNSLYSDLYFYSFLLRYYAITRFIVGFTSMLFQLILSFIILLLIRSSIMYQYLRHYFSALVSLNIIITIIGTSISLVNKKKRNIFITLYSKYLFFLPNNKILKI